MENTIENKAKFFIQYWGQKVLFDGIEGLEFVSINSMYECFVEKRKNAWLDLIPLQDITDEDAEHTGINVEYERFNELTIDLIDADYLRSKGYALPFMGLSVNELVECGWLKLKTTKDEKQ